VEQDVEALFNQMLSAGIIRGLQLLASSQFQQYDGLYRVSIEPPFDKYVLSEENPLGVPKENFAGTDEAIKSPVKVLEYKYSFDALIEEFTTGEKNPGDIGLVVVWEMGNSWKQMFDVLSYLDEENQHHRSFHGITHSVQHSVSGSHAFVLIVLQDLVAYLLDRSTESARQRDAYSVDCET
jgi:hypothetical protein